MPMIVTRTDALKNFDICQAGVVCGGRGNPGAESIKNAKYKIRKNITHTNISVKFLKYCFDVEHEHGNHHYQCQLSMSTGNVMIEEYTYLRSLFTYL